MPDFLFITCQVGAERAVKGEMARSWPDFRFAYSRPGFLTFKLPDDHGLADDFDLHSVFARAYGFSLGKVRGKDQVEMARQAWELFGKREAKGDSPIFVDTKIGTVPKVERIHVWARDAAEPGEHGYQPGITGQAIEVHARLVEQWPCKKTLDPKAVDTLRMFKNNFDESIQPALTPGPSPVSGEPALTPGPSPVSGEPALTPGPSPVSGEGSRAWESALQSARHGEYIFDCVLVEPDEWWIGYHRADQVSSRWPGGMLALELPPDAVSRAWLKMEEALLWSQLPIPKGAHVAEIGSAPGGASQALLARGMIVTGIDPAEMSAEVLNNPHFTHLRRRSTQVRRREFRKIRWLAVDMNVAPNYTLDAVEAIVLHPQVRIRGMILTLKLPEWNLAACVPGYIERIKGWGYNIVRARQLQHNRREICVVALQRPFRR